MRAEKSADLASVARSKAQSLIGAAAGELVTLWLKRVRKEARTRFRYCLVRELHKDGQPHFHLLIHEVAGANAVRHAVLTRQWHFGFSRFKLVEDDADAARYCAKYLSKDATARVRASVGYGRADYHSAFAAQDHRSARKPLTPSPNALAPSTTDRGRDYDFEWAARMRRLGED